MRFHHLYGTFVFRIPQSHGYMKHSEDGLK